MAAGLLPLAMEDVLEFVQQFLGAANAEGGDDDRPAVFECALDHGAQALTAVATVFMHAITIGALHDHDVRLPGGARCRQQGRVGCSEVAREQHAAPYRPGLARQFEFDVDRTQDVTGALQANPAAGVGTAVQRVPVTIGQGAQTRLHDL